MLSGNARNAYVDEVDTQISRQIMTECKIIGKKLLKENRLQHSEKLGSIPSKSSADPRVQKTQFFLFLFYSCSYDADSL